jgi:hypothetical protein
MQSQFQKKRIQAQPQRERILQLAMGAVVGLLIVCVGNAVRAASFALTFKLEPDSHIWDISFQ